MTTASPEDKSAASSASPFDGPSTWQLDAQASSVTFSHKTMWGLATVRGKFGEVSGFAEIPASGPAHGRLEIAAASIDTKLGKRDTHLRSADFFNTAVTPAIVAEISEATRQGDTVAASGTLTVAGTTRPLALTAKIAEATAGAITLAAETEFNRADFGMTWNQLGMIKGNALVSVAATFVKSAAG